MILYHDSKYHGMFNVRDPASHVHGWLRVKGTNWPEESEERYGMRRALQEEVLYRLMNTG